jgi:hypothetical protein
MGLMSTNLQKLTGRENLIFNAVGDLVGIQNPHGVGADLDLSPLGVFVCNAMGTAFAAANAAGLQNRLNAVGAAGGGVVMVFGYGRAYCNPVFIPTGVSLSIAPGLILTRNDGTNAPLIRNKYGGQQNKATRFNRASNLVTVNNRFHGLSVGQSVWVGNLTDTTMCGVQTVATVPDPHSWTYVSGGSDGAGGAATVFGAIIPLRRALAGSAFSSTANVVTVTDPQGALELRPGMKAWLGTTGASTSFVGVVEVTDTDPVGGTWTYLTTASGTGAATGTIALSYDYDISITGDGRIDGNPLNNGSQQDVDLMLSLVSFGMLNNGRVDVKSITGTIFRCLNFFNATGCTVERTEFGDTLVGVQFEGGAKNCEVKNVRGTTGKWVSGSRLADDAVAFTGSKVNGGSYDSTTSPYGLDSFTDCKVSGLYMPNCLNGVKQSGDSSVTFDEMVYEDINTGMTSNTLTPLSGGNSAIRMVDDSNGGLLGMTCGNIYIRRVRAYGGGGAINWLTKGTANILDIDGVSFTPNALQALGNTNSAVSIANATTGSGSIKRLRIANINYVSPGAQKPTLSLGNSNVAATTPIAIEELVLEGFDLTPNANASGACIVKYGNCTLTSVRLSNGKFRGPASGTGFAIAITGANNAGKWLLDNVTTVAGGTALGVLFGYIASDNTTSSVDLTLRNCTIACTSLVYDNGSATSGSFTLRLQGGNVTPTGKVFNCASSTAALNLYSDATTSLPALTSSLVATAGALRLQGPSGLSIDGAILDGTVANNAANASFYNTNAAFGTGVGAYVRGSATWTRVAA